MSMKRASYFSLAAIARRVLRWGVILTFVGATLALIVSALSGTASLVAKFGAVLTVVGLAIAFVATPFAFMLTVTSIGCRIQGKLGRDQERDSDS
jgi:hypothetical protein